MDALCPEQVRCQIRTGRVSGRPDRRPWRYRWSRAAAHVGHTDRDELVALESWRRLSAGLDWSALLTEPEDELAVSRLRSSTRTGWRLGGDSFVSKLERRLGRRLRPLPAGRRSDQMTEDRNRNR